MAIFVTESQVAELLDMPSAIEAVEGIMRLHGEGRALNTPRQRVRRKGAILHWMAATALENYAHKLIAKLSGAKRHWQLKPHSI